MSLAKLTAISTKTLSLLLERQRLQSLPSFTSSGPTSTDSRTNGNSLHFPQIKRNLNQLRVGILALEAKDGSSIETARLLRNQYDRMRGMLAEGEQAEIPRCQTPPTNSTSSLEPEDTLPPPKGDTSRPSGPTHTTSGRDSLLSQPTFAPYTDDPEQGFGVEPPEPATMLQTQRYIMEEQDAQLDQLSHSINRQHHISLQINEELDVHSGLLQELDTDIDRTQGRLSRAQRGLDQVARGVKNNSSVVAIGLLIFVLLILIIRYKT
ncbi:hypothetical protein B0H34DRAFT_661204 [Crassisporium funariophilum]|nr:hypothetical protein B0H34DRAFT_661204 [Crassisporium funariophilum]